MSSKWAKKNAATSISIQIIELEQKCASAELWLTMHALNRAKQIIGWEGAGEMDKAHAITRDEDPYA